MHWESGKFTWLTYLWYLLYGSSLKLNLPYLWGVLVCHFPCPNPRWLPTAIRDKFPQDWPQPGWPPVVVPQSWGQPAPYGPACVASSAKIAFPASDPQTLGPLLKCSSGVAASRKPPMISVSVWSKASPFLVPVCCQGLLTDWPYSTPAPHVAGPAVSIHPSLRGFPCGLGCESIDTYREPTSYVPRTAEYTVVDTIDMVAALVQFRSQLGR